MSGGERDGFATWVLRAGELEAELAPGVGMVCCSLRHAGEELLGQRRGLAAYAQRGSTMGVPILYPWANRLGGFAFAFAGRVLEIDPRRVRTEEHGLPIHGLLGGSPHWAVTERGEDRIAAELDFAAHPELLEAFPFPHVVAMEVALGAGAARWTTTVSATGDVEVPIAFGYHPYLRLPGVPRAEWEVELPRARHLRLDERMLPTGEAEEVAPLRGPLGQRTLDDAYALDGPARFALRGGGREVVVTFDEGYPFAQVIAPPGDEVVCFEPMTAPANALVSGWGLRSVAPGRRFVATFTVTIRGA